MRKVLSVTAINKYLKNILDSDFILSEAFVMGEVSNFKTSGGHFYFTLKDENAAINVVMFKNNAINLKFSMENGIEVMIFGNISMYEKTGQVQIYAEIVEPYGIGALNFSIEQLKQKLSEKGIFDNKHKRTISENIKTIGLITSGTGSVVHDMMKITKMRDPSVNIIIIPTIVQGIDAERSIVSSIDMANEYSNDYSNIDVLVLARGGGSTEDLMPFNTESVAMAIYYSKIPIISAIGHETDFTIADLVADLRASTPSNAIELCIKESSHKLNYALQLLESVQYFALNKLEQNKNTFSKVLSHSSFKNPLKFVYDRQIYLQMLLKNIENLSPLAVLSKGYAIVHNLGEEISKRDIIKLELLNKIIEAEVKGVFEKSEK